MGLSSTQFFFCGSLSRFTPEIIVYGRFRVPKLSKKLGCVLIGKEVNRGDTEISGASAETVLGLLER